MISLPMYDVWPEDTQSLTREIQHRLRLQGFADNETRRVRPGDLLAHWQSGRLLLSQACGYPLVTRLRSVRTVGCFHYTAAGCHGPQYRSYFVARLADRHKTPEDFAGQRLVCNAPDSQSGYNVWVSRLTAEKPLTGFFSAVSFSGGHRHSLQAVRRQSADITAIDCVSLALLQRHFPQESEGLVIVGESPLTPGLPLITAGNTSDQQLVLLRTTLQAIVSDPSCRPLCDRLLIQGFSAIERQAYPAVPGAV